MDVGFLSGFGLGLSIGLAVALRLMTARDPVTHAQPRQREEKRGANSPAHLTDGQRERMEGLR